MKSAGEIALEIVKGSYFEGYEETKEVVKRISEAITAERAALAEIKESINLLTCKKVNAEDELKDVKAALASKEAEIATLIASKLVVPSHPQETFDKVLDVANKNTILETELLSCAETIRRYQEFILDLTLSCACGGQFPLVKCLACEKNKLLALPPHASEKRVKAMLFLIESLRKDDPVYDDKEIMESLESQIKGLNKTEKHFFKRCALCRAKGPDNQENVTHKPDCAWMLSKTLAACEGKSA